MKINLEMFREYDIRGIAESDLACPISIALGKAVGTYFREKGIGTLVIGRDCRLSSERLFLELSEGLLSTGINIVDIGLVPTPLVYYSLHQYDDVGGGVMITASHNPSEYNGLKISCGTASIHGEEIKKIAELLETDDFEKGEGKQEYREVKKAYVDMIYERIGKLSRPLRVVVDAGNGMASELAPKVYRELGCEVTELFCELNGRFPNHHPDPTIKENLSHLVASVKRNKADFGIAYDGDADRLGVVDHEGRIVWGDEIMILFSREILSRVPGATIIGEVKCSNNLYREVEKNGGKAIMWKAGHSLIKEKMRSSGAVLAGEMSGHIFFSDGFYGFDDAIFAGARLLKLVADSSHSIRWLLRDVPEIYNTPEIKIQTREDLKFKIVQRLQEHFNKEYETVTIDGVRISFKHGWGLVRASNTGPNLVLRFEANSSKQLARIRSLVESKVMDVISGMNQECG